MAYYCIVTTVVKNRPSGLKIDYELRDDSVTPHTVVDRGSLGIEMLAFDALAEDGLTPLTNVQRRQYVRDQVETHFRGLIKRVRGADTDAAQVLVALNGFRVP